MPLIKLASAARRARMGSSNAIRRALTAAGVPLVTLASGDLAVEEADLNYFLVNRQDEPAPPPPAPRPQTTLPYTPPSYTGPKPRPNKRRQ